MEDRFEFQEQLVLSQDLLQLLEWLLQYNQEGINNLVKQALQRGLADKLKKSGNNYPIEDAHYTIIDFLEMLENSLAEGVQNQALNDLGKKKLVQAINRIDTTNCSKATIESSAALVGNRSVDSTQDEAKSELCKELLRRWNPDFEEDEDEIIN